MFADGYRQLLAAMPDLDDHGGGDTRALFEEGVRGFESCVADPVRFHCCSSAPSQTSRPSEQSYTLTIAAIDDPRQTFAVLGIEDPAAIDLWTRADRRTDRQEPAEDPGGDPWAAARRRRDGADAPQNSPPARCSRRGQLRQSPALGGVGLVVNQEQ